jgi:hypothetical protein
MRRAGHPPQFLWAEELEPRHLLSGSPLDSAIRQFGNENTSDIYRRLDVPLRDVNQGPLSTFLYSVVTSGPSGRVANSSDGFVSQARPALEPGNGDKPEGSPDADDFEGTGKLAVVSGELAGLENRHSARALDSTVPSGVGSVQLSFADMNAVKPISSDGMNAVTARAGVIQRLGSEALLSFDGALSSIVGRSAGMRSNCGRAGDWSDDIWPGVSPLLPDALTRQALTNRAPACASLRDGSSATLLDSSLSATLQQLSNVELAAIERSIQQFLGHLNPASDGFMSSDEGSGPLPLVVAVAATALACEIGRRQWRRSLAETERVRKQELIGLP